jgi:deoxyadenosine/deoxycytidine kinase
MTQINIISIEGNIGSGKSTLLTNLKSYFSDNPNIIFLKEPVDEWNNICDENGVTMLEKFYNDQLKYSFPFQMMAYISRLKILRDTVETIKKSNSNEKHYIITERSLYTDKMVFAKMLYDSKMIEHINYQIYLNWFDTFSGEFNVDKIIYIDADPTICCNRIKKRHRDGENNISYEYISNCRDYHNQMLDVNSSECVCKDQLVLDGNNDIYENKDILYEWINCIESFLYK